MKKLIAALLAVLMLLSICPVYAFAEVPEPVTKLNLVLITIPFPEFQEVPGAPEVPEGAPYSAQVEWKYADSEGTVGAVDGSLPNTAAKVFADITVKANEGYAFAGGAETVYDSDCIVKVNSAVVSVFADGEEDTNGFRFGKGEAGAAVTDELFVVITQNVHPHRWDEEWTFDENGHWHKCLADGCDIADYSSCGLSGADYGEHIGTYFCAICDWEDPAGAKAFLKGEAEKMLSGISEPSELLLKLVGEYNDKIDTFDSAKEVLFNSIQNEYQLLFNKILIVSVIERGKSYITDTTLLGYMNDILSDVDSITDLTALIYEGDFSDKANFLYTVIMVEEAAGDPSKRSEAVQKLVDDATARMLEAYTLGDIYECDRIQYSTISRIELQLAREEAIAAIELMAGDKDSRTENVWYCVDDYISRISSAKSKEDIEKLLGDAAKKLDVQSAVNDSMAQLRDTVEKAEIFDKDLFIEVVMLYIRTFDDITQISAFADGSFTDALNYQIANVGKITEAFEEIVTAAGEDPSEEITGMIAAVRRAFSSVPLDDIFNSVYETALQEVKTVKAREDAIEEIEAAAGSKVFRSKKKQQLVDETKRMIGDSSIEEISSVIGNFYTTLEFITAQDELLKKIDAILASDITSTFLLEETFLPFREKVENCTDIDKLSDFAEELETYIDMYSKIDPEVLAYVEGITVDDIADAWYEITGTEAPSSGSALVYLIATWSMIKGEIEYSVLLHSDITVEQVKSMVDYLAIMVFVISTTPMTGDEGLRIYAEESTISVEPGQTYQRPDIWIENSRHEHIIENPEPRSVILRLNGSIFESDAILPDKCIEKVDAIDGYGDYFELLIYDSLVDGQTVSPYAIQVQMRMALDWPGENSLVYDGTNQIDKLVATTDTGAEIVYRCYDSVFRDAGSRCNVMADVYIDGRKISCSNWDMYFNMQKRPLRISGITARSKAYDGTTNVVFDTDNIVIDGLVPGDDVRVSVTGGFENNTVGSGKKVNFTVSISGTDAKNYYLAEGEQQTETTADIYEQAQFTLTAPAASGITYGQKLSESTLSGGKVCLGESPDPLAGTFAWAHGDIVPSVADSEVRTFTVIFTPEDDQYSKIYFDITLTVAPAKYDTPAENTGYVINYTDGIIYVSEGYEFCDEEGTAYAETHFPVDFDTALYVRKKADDNHSASDKRSVNVPNRPAAVSTPVLIGYDCDKLTVQTVSGVEFSLDCVNWQSEGVFKMPDGSEISVYARLKATDTALSGQIGEPLSVTVDLAVLRAEAKRIINEKAADIQVTDYISGISARIDAANTVKAIKKILGESIEYLDILVLRLEAEKAIDEEAAKGEITDNIAAVVSDAKAAISKAEYAADICELRDGCILDIISFRSVTHHINHIMEAAGDLEAFSDKQKLVLGYAEETLRLITDDYVREFACDVFCNILNAMRLQHTLLSKLDVYIEEHSDYPEIKDLKDFAKGLLPLTEQYRCYFENIILFIDDNELFWEKFGEAYSEFILFESMFNKEVPVDLTEDLITELIESYKENDGFFATTVLSELSLALPKISAADIDALSLYVFDKHFDKLTEDESRELYRGLADMMEVFDNEITEDYFNIIKHYNDGTLTESELTDIYKKRIPEFLWNDPYTGSYLLMYEMQFSQAFKTSEDKREVISELFSFVLMLKNEIYSYCIPDFLEALTFGREDSARVSKAINDMVYSGSTEDEIMGNISEGVLAIIDVMELDAAANEALAAIYEAAGDEETRSPEMKNLVSGAENNIANVQTFEDCETVLKEMLAAIEYLKDMDEAKENAIDTLRSLVTAPLSKAMKELLSDSATKIMETTDVYEFASIFDQALIEVQLQQARDDVYNEIVAELGEYTDIMRAEDLEYSYSQLMEMTSLEKIEEYRDGSISAIRLMISYLELARRLSDIAGENPSERVQNIYDEAYDKILSASDVSAAELLFDEYCAEIELMQSKEALFALLCEYADGNETEDVTNVLQAAETAIFDAESEEDANKQYDEYNIRLIWCIDRTSLLDEVFAQLDAIVGEDASQVLSDKLGEAKTALSAIDDLDAFISAYQQKADELKSLLKFENANKEYEALLSIEIDKNTALFYEYLMICEELGSQLNELTESEIDDFLACLSGYRYYLANGMEAQILNFCEYIEGLFDEAKFSEYDKAYYLHINLKQLYLKYRYSSYLDLFGTEKSIEKDVRELIDGYGEIYAEKLADVNSIMNEFKENLPASLYAYLKDIMDDIYDLHSVAALESAYTYMSAQFLPYFFFEIDENISKAVAGVEEMLKITEEFDESAPYISDFLLQGFLLIVQSVNNDGFLARLLSMVKEEQQFLSEAIGELREDAEKYSADSFKGYFRRKIADYYECFFAADISQMLFEDGSYARTLIDTFKQRQELLYLMGDMAEYTGEFDNLFMKVLEMLLSIDEKAVNGTVSYIPFYVGTEQLSELLTNMLAVAQDVHDGVLTTVDDAMLSLVTKTLDGETSEEFKDILDEFVEFQKTEPNKVAYIENVSYVITAIMYYKHLLQFEGSDEYKSAEEIFKDFASTGRTPAYREKLISTFAVFYPMSDDIAFRQQVKLYYIQILDDDLSIVLLPDELAEIINEGKPITYGDDYTVAYPDIYTLLNDKIPENLIVYDKNDEIPEGGARLELIYYMKGENGNDTELDEKPAEAGDYYLRVRVYAPDGNYEYFDYDFTISPKTVTVSGIIATDKEYDGTTDAVLDALDATINGLISDDEGKVGVIASGSYADGAIGENKKITITEITLTGDMAHCYVIATSGNQTEVTGNITKCSVTVSTLPTAGEMTYGQKLSDITLSGGEASTDGKFEWADGTTVPSVSDSGKTEYTVRFVPDNTDLYAETTCTITVTVKKADQTAPAAAEGYTVNYADETVSLSEGYELSTSFESFTAIAADNDGKIAVTPGSTYYIRKAADDNRNASSATAITMKSRPEAPASPTFASKTYNSLTVTEADGIEFSTNGSKWQTSGTFTGLTLDTTYTVYARKAATDSDFAGEASEPITVDIDLSIEKAAAKATINQNVSQSDPDTVKQAAADAIAAIDESDTKETLDQALAEGLANIALAKDILAFEAYRDAAIVTANGKVDQDSLEERTKAVEDAVAELGKLEFNAEKTLAENKAAVDGILDDLDAALALKVSVSVSLEASDINGGNDIVFGDDYTVDVPTVLYHSAALDPQPELVYLYEVSDGKGGWTALNKKPENAGDYRLTVSVSENEPDFTGSASLTFAIQKKTVTIEWTAESFTYSGLDQKDSLMPTTEEGVELSVNITKGGSSITNFIDAGDYTVTVIGISGDDADNYTLPTDAEMLTKDYTMQKLTVTVSGITAKDKPYDSTNSAEFDCTNAVITGVIDSDKAKVAVTASGNFSDEELGEDKNVTITEITLSGDRAANYALAAEGQQTVSSADIIAATPTVTKNPTASEITYGQKLSDSTLSDGTANVPGTFAWKTGTTAPSVSDSGKTEYEVVFTPNDATHYTSVTVKVKVTVQKASQTAPANAEGYTVDYINEKISVTDGYEISLSSESFVAVAPDKDGKIALVPGNTYYVRKAENENYNASSATAFTAVSRPEAPSAQSFTVTEETVANKKDGSMSGITSDMEYSVDGGKKWTAGPATLQGLSDETVLVRLKATSTAPYGNTYTKSFTASTVMITVTFVSGENQQVAYGKKLKKPADPVKIGFILGGWYENEQLTGDAWDFDNDTVTNTLTLYPKWIEDLENKIVIKGTVIGEMSGVIEGAVVKLFNNANKTTYTSVTESDGTYRFPNVNAGSYSVSVSYSGKILTKSITVSEFGATVLDITMPDKDISSSVDYEGTSDSEKLHAEGIVVDGVDKVAEGFTPGNDESISVTLAVKSTVDEAETDDCLAIQTMAGEDKAIEYFILSLEKQINGGAASDIGNDNTVLLDIRVPFDSTGLTGIEVYRYHAGQAEKITSEPNENGEYIEIFTDCIILHVAKFSVYAIGYDAPKNICIGKQKTSLSEGMYELYLGGKSVGKFSFIKDGDGWDIYDGEKYIALYDGKVAYSTAPFKWEYHNGCFSLSQTTIQQTSGRWILFVYIPGTTKSVTTTYYLNSVKNGDKLSTSTVKAEFYEDVPFEDHVGKWICNGDGTHSRTCTRCGETEILCCDFENDQHTCPVCGGYDPALQRVDVLVMYQVKTVKRSFGLIGRIFGLGKSITTYNATVYVNAIGLKVTKVEVSARENGGWTESKTFTSEKQIKKFYARITTSDGKTRLYAILDGIAYPAN